MVLPSWIRYSVEEDIDLIGIAKLEGNQPP
jgi:hypothetical protein